MSADIDSEWNFMSSCAQLKLGDRKGSEQLWDMDDHEDDGQSLALTGINLPYATDIDWNKLKTMNGLR